MRTKLEIIDDVDVSECRHYSKFSDMNCREDRLCPCKGRYCSFKHFALRKKWEVLESRLQECLMEVVPTGICETCRDKTIKENSQLIKKFDKLIEYMSKYENTKNLWEKIMGTSCIIALQDTTEGDTILLEKTHDGFPEEVQKLIDMAHSKGYTSTEDLVEFFLKETDVRYSIYSHKYPLQACIYLIDKDKFITLDIEPDKPKIMDYLPEINAAIQKYSQFMK